MEQKCPSCGSCGMPMKKIEDFGGRSLENKYCVHCSDDEGNLTATFEGIVNYYTDDFIKQRGLDVDQARKLAEESVSKMSAWSS